MSTGNTGGTGLPLGPQNEARIAAQLQREDQYAHTTNQGIDHHYTAPPDSYTQGTSTAAVSTDDVLGHLPAFPSIGTAPRSGGVVTHNAAGAHQEPYNEKDNYGAHPTESTSDAVAQRSSEIGHLARQMSRTSQLSRQASRRPGMMPQLSRANSTAVENPFEYEEGGDLDPYSANFNARKYVRSLGALGKGSERLSGIAYKNLSVSGLQSDADYQKTVGNYPLALIGGLRDAMSNRKRKVPIIEGLDGVLEAGEMLVVLGPPGSGCSTLLKSIAGEYNGLYLDESSEINYRGITPKQMHSQFRGEAIYTAEVDVHLPTMTVGETLAFAAEARAPREPPAGLTRRQFAEHSRNVIMSVFGISHTMNTIVGNDFIRGVSGGERKRVTISEAALANAPLQCWDNSTRGLDSANAVEFCKNLRLSAEFTGNSSVVAIYQAPQSAYDIFDKVCVLYEGQQIFFGKCGEAKQFFLDMGFDCPEQQTVPDFLTSLTSPSERKAKAGYEGKVPNTPEEFARMWKQSPQYHALQREIGEFNARHPVNGERYEEFLSSRRAQQAKNARVKSPYTLSYGQQVMLCLRRGFWRLRADPSLTLTQLFGNMVMALIISSVFFNLQPDTGSFYNRGSLLFFAILINAFGAALEILTLYAQRPIVEKHTQYAFYHSSAEAFASMLTDIPYKILNAIVSNLVLYFMTNLRREPGAFFFYLLTSFMATLAMSMIFRSIAAMSRQFVAAMTPAAFIMVALVIYTGFAIPVTKMRGWARWINYINPVGYGFEALMVNEFSGRNYACSLSLPTYPDVPATARACSVPGSVLGQDYVNGDAYINVSYQYYASHKWRNIGILAAYIVAFLGVYLAATELISAQRSKGEILVYPRGQIPRELKRKKSNDAESQASGRTNSEKNGFAASGEKTGTDKVDEGIIQKQTAIFTWKDVVYDIKIKKEERRILDHVDGWVKPGTLTALMGVSGAGKTTLLDVLATRVTMGVVTGEILVDGGPRDVSFQRKTGYVQQQDLHLATSTVREALRFSAELRQPAHVSKEEKYAYVEEVLKLLEMDTYGNAIVGVPGEGLNVEQRKRLTIGVELVAKPELLLFLDEPTSGLDSQTSWNILQLLRKLTAAGQAILCTIHQPSAILFENFDRLLFLAKGGKTVYFGPVGANSHILIDYFVRNGAPPCPKGENPAEWMLSVIGAAPGSHTDVDWHAAWKASEERVGVRAHLDEIKATRPQQAASERDARPEPDANELKRRKSQYKEFAAPFWVQTKVVVKRVFQQYWRTPSYIYSKFFLSIAISLFLGFSFFRADRSQAGLQSQLFSAFMMFLIFGQLVQQIMPMWVQQRSMYEVRERPAKTFSWKVFVLSNILVEIPWSVLVATLFFLCWYYPIGYQENATFTNTVAERGALMFLYTQQFFLFTATFAFMIIAGMELAETAGNIAQLLFSLTLIFNGVLVPYNVLPGFWKFMYRVSPFTYFVEGMLGTAVANAPVTCGEEELVRVITPQGTCGQYLEAYISGAGGYIVNPDSTSECQFCALSSTNAFLENFSIKYENRWRDFGIIWVYIVVNAAAAFGLYWLARVPKNKGKESGAKSEKANAPPAPESTEPGGK